MTTIPGGMLENYKNWYLQLPKIFRIALLPGAIALLGAWLQIFEIEKSLKWYAGIAFLVLLAVSAYNQLIEADTKEEYKKKNDELEAERAFWQRKYGDASFLTKLYSTMVLKKSDMWLKALVTAEESGVEAARNYVRKENGLNSNIDRIVALIFEAFRRHTDDSTHQAIRVSYLVPNETHDRLILRSWCNQEIKIPHAVNANPDAFSRNGNSLASFVWTKASQEHFYFIDDVEGYCKQHSDDEGVFSYLNNGQRSSIRSIFCYRVVDGMERNCLGVICVDSNTPNMFQGAISEDICKDIVISASSRIVYETRFAMMKTKLGPYDEVQPNGTS